MHDMNRAEMYKMLHELESEALSHVLITRSQWERSISKYLTYPKDAKLVQQHQAMLAEQSRLKEEGLKTYETENAGNAWRWLMLREAELEDKMEGILQKGDLDLYHQVKSYEMAKVEDALKSEFAI